MHRGKTRSGNIRLPHRRLGNGSARTLVLGCLAAAGLLLITFVIIELLSADPMFDLSLFRLPTFSGTVFSSQVRSQATAGASQVSALALNAATVLAGFRASCCAWWWSGRRVS